MGTNGTEDKRESKLSEKDYIWKERYAICLDSGVPEFKARKIANESVKRFLEQTVKKC